MLTYRRGTFGGKGNALGNGFLSGMPFRENVATPKEAASDVPVVDLGVARKGEKTGSKEEEGLDLCAFFR